MEVKQSGSTILTRWSPGGSYIKETAVGGFTGHACPPKLKRRWEHLLWFNLINMNGRVYDPLVGQFLNPDNHVQAPYFTQSLNRYGYCLNNPLKYTDPTGEKWKWWSLMLAEIITGGQISITEASIAATGLGAQSLANGIDYTSSYLRSFSDPGKAGKQFDNAIRTDFGILNSFTGMFRYDKGAKGIEWPLQVWNNLTGGEGLQTILGNGFSHIQNIGNKVEGVRYYQGRTIVRLKEHFLFQDRYGFDGISLGHYVTGENIAYSPTDKTGEIDLFAHEFAHTFQSRITGPGYLLKYGIPSGPLLSNVPEKDANYRAYKNLKIQPWDDPMEFNRTNSWEFFSFPFIWPFMWDWND